jgi:hypothetical protein
LSSPEETTQLHLSTVATDITKGIKSIPVGGTKWPITTLDNNITVKRLNSAMGVIFMYPSNLFQFAITI